MSTHGGGAARSRGAPLGGGNAGQGREVLYTGGRNEQHVRAALGRDLSPAEIADLVGAQPGARVEFGPMFTIIAHETDGSMHSVAIEPPGRDHAAAREMYRWAHVDAAGHSIDTPAAVQASMARQAQALGMERITAQARGGTNDVIRLLELGYDAPIDETFITEVNGRALGPGMDRLHRVSDILAMPGGEQWLRTYAANPKYAFDLAPGSRSISVLSAYLQAHGLPPV